MPVKLNEIPHNKSFDDDGKCNCKPVPYQGLIYKIIKKILVY